MRLSVSIPRDLLNETDKIAHAKRLSRSKLIAECLSNLVESEKKMLLAQGYIAMAKKHSDFADLSAEAAKEVVPPWK